MSNSRNNALTYDMSAEDLLRATAEDPEAVFFYLTYLEEENIRMSQKLRAISEALKSTHGVADETTFTSVPRPRVLAKYAEIVIDLDYPFSKYGFSGKPTSPPYNMAVLDNLKPNSDTNFNGLGSKKCAQNHGESSLELSDCVTYLNCSPSPPSTKKSFSFDPNKEFTPVPSVKLPSGFPTTAQNSCHRFMRDMVRTPTPPNDFSQVKQPSSPYNNVHDSPPTVVLPPSDSLSVIGTQRDIVDSESTPASTLCKNPEAKIYVSDDGIIDNLQCMAVEHNVAFGGFQYASQPLYTINESTECEETNCHDSEISAYGSKASTEVLSAGFTSSLDHAQDKVTTLVNEINSAFSVSSDELDEGCVAVPVTINNDVSIDNIEQEVIPVSTVSSLASSFEDWFNTVEIIHNRVTTPRAQAPETTVLSKGESLEVSEPESKSSFEGFKLLELPLVSNNLNGVESVSGSTSVDGSEAAPKPESLDIPKQASVSATNFENSSPQYLASKATSLRYSIEVLLKAAPSAANSDISLHPGIKELNEWTARKKFESNTIEKINETSTQIVCHGRQAGVARAGNTVFSPQQSTDKKGNAEGKENLVISN